MRVALYARVSTKDKDQDNEMQLVPLREHCRSKGWAFIEFEDEASAGNLAGRKDWRRLLSRLGEFDLILVWKLDRAFRSLLHCMRTMEQLERAGVGFSCLTQPFDTTNALGRMMLQILAVFSEFERAQTSERVREGLVNARRKGMRLGRPPAAERPGFAAAWAAVRPQLARGELSQRAAARRLAISPPTLARLLAAEPKKQGRPRITKTLAA
jgi:DNA invertase Pin-like site-specific DNA recombinase